MVLERIDGLGRGAWIALVVAGFWFWWPIGLAMLLFLTVGRRHRGSAGRWQQASSNGSAGDGPFGAFKGRGCWSGRSRSSGNGAFDEYRQETLRRLEDEQHEFDSYLERLRQARDKSEFDAFMAERRNRQTPQAPATEA